MAVCYSSIKHHKLKRRVELKEREELDILKNNFNLSYQKNMYNFISITTFMVTTLLDSLECDMFTKCFQIMQGGRSFESGLVV